MLVKCPRCGFSQPQDKYCAQCGIDMESFKPPRQSAFMRYATDPLLYLGIALIAVGLSLGSLYKRDKSDLAQRVKFLKGNLQIASTNGQESKMAISDEEAEEDANEDARSAAATTALTPPPAVPTAESSTPSAATTAGPTAYIYYAEVPRAALEKLYEESQATGQFNSFGDYTAGILPDMQKRIMAPGLKIRILEKSEKPITKNQQWFAGVHDSEFGEDLGLSTFIELAEFENNSFRGSLEIVRSLRELDPDRARNLATADPSALAPQKNSYPAIFELGPGYGFFVSGVLPRKTRLVQEEQLTAKGPFEILKSPAFQNKESEFVMFIEFEKKP